MLSIEWAHKPVLVQVLGESLQSQRSVAFRSSDQVSNGWCQGTGGSTGVNVRLANHKVSRGGNTDTSEGEEADLNRREESEKCRAFSEFRTYKLSHVDTVEWKPTMPAFPGRPPFIPDRPWW